jgi:adenine-specific DNA-methyltransferase
MEENPVFLSRQLVTYLGNKRRLLPFIGGALSLVQRRLGRERLVIFDAFSGSGAAARFFKQYASTLMVNDIEPYGESISRCYLANRSEIPEQHLIRLHRELSRWLREEPLREGFISELYAPRREDEILPGERVFYTPRNARFIDTARQYIGEIEKPFRDFFIAPLLSEASIHANTSGVFKGFYKDSGTGRGRYGGNSEDALSRIKGDMDLPFPVWSNFEGSLGIYREDANRLVSKIPEADLAYLDPPYNQHPYGSNYFMFNLICSYERPKTLSPVSGIPGGWNRSAYNRRGEAAGAFKTLVERIKAKFLVISFNSEGFISLEEMKRLLECWGKVEILETPYNTFRGSRNLKKRRIHLKEYLYVVEKNL